jgi:hypothetical protein
MSVVAMKNVSSSVYKYKHPFSHSLPKVLSLYLLFLSSSLALTVYSSVLHTMQAQNVAVHSSAMYCMNSKCNM